MASTLDPRLDSKLRALKRRSEEISASLADPEVTSDVQRYTSLSRSYAELEPIVAKLDAYDRASEELEGARELLGSADDAELRRMATDEVKQLEADAQQLERELRVLLLPSDPNDAKNVVLEIRAGAGGDEASLFAGEVFRMYSRYAEGQRWTMRTTDLSQNGIGGVKEVIALVEGNRVYSRLKYESGVHRVQRVPETETQGRIHTSTVTVAVLPEADDVDVKIEEKELRIDTFCSSGPGGQSVNTTQSAVRIVHLPTQLVVQCQDEKSWHKNKARALQVLRSRLYDRMLAERNAAIAKERKGMVQSGDRAEKIRTYNFPQSRITDHRIGLTAHNLQAVLDGDIGEFVEALTSHDQAERLKVEVEG